MGQLEQAVSLLDSLGAHVNLRARMHEKLAVVDEHILWDGSLNILSYFNTTERLNRWQGLLPAKKALIQHNLLHCTREADMGMQTNSSTRIAQQIARRRQSMGLTQRQLAERVGVRQSAISEIETGKRHLRMDLIDSVCAQLDLDVLVSPKYMTHAVCALLQRAEESPGVPRRP